MAKNFHSFHIVDMSPWPIISSFNLFNLMLNSIIMLKMFNNLNIMTFVFSFVLLIFSSFMWWRDIIRESTFQGFHTINIIKMLKISMILFIMSEIMFFTSFFWSYFNFCLSPDIEIGNMWPPLGINMFNPFQIPLLNTIILLSSGVTITWAHHAMLNKNYKTSNFSLMITFILGGIFSFFQMLEYKWSEFSINDSVFGSIFFMSTGFHGIHVLIGTIMILSSFMRNYNLHFNNKHHFGFEAAAWYWHFVDVVWLYLYIFMYWWFYFLINMK